MRLFWAFMAAAALAGCGDSKQEAAGAEIEAGLWTDGERSGLCVGESGKAAFVTYAPSGDANCMARGRLSEDDALSFIPAGDTQCTIAVARNGETLTLGNGGDACAYYCGGDASFAAREFVKTDGEPGDLRDVAGDPLC